LIDEGERIGGYGGLVWLALGKGSCYLFWLIWGVLRARKGLAFFHAQKMPIYLINILKSKSFLAIKKRSGLFHFFMKQRLNLKYMYVEAKYGRNLPK